MRMDLDKDINYIDPSVLSHENFVSKLNSGEIVIGVDVPSANYLYVEGAPLAKYSGIQALYRYICFSGPPFFIISVYFFGWWSLLFLVQAVVGHKLTSYHTREMVTKEVRQNKSFYEDAAWAGIIIYQEA